MSVSSPASPFAKSFPGNLPATIEWVGEANGFLRLLDQTRLPGAVEFLDCRSAEQVHAAIRRLSVRGAPAIGVAAAFGVCLGMREQRDRRGASLDDFARELDRVVAYLGQARPTAVNLMWACQRMAETGRKTIERCHHLADSDLEAVWGELLKEARRMMAEDTAVCRRIGEHGADLMPSSGAVLTHCNAGALATTAWGTALAAIYVAHERGKRFRVFADETRPLLQGARLTAFELAAAGVDVTVICDNMAGWLMRRGEISAVIVGADRIAANGDAANKIGTYSVAVLAAHHKVPFYVAAPSSTFDLKCASGAEIPIEERSEQELREWGGNVVIPAGARVFNPAFDVTPAGLIAGIITENGVAQPVSESTVASVLRAGR